MGGPGLSLHDTRGGVLENVRRSFARILQRANLPTLRIHDLRHTAATLMLVGGVHPKVVQEMLGHSNVALTLNTYSHVLPTMQQQATVALEALLAELKLA